MRFNESDSLSANCLFHFTRTKGNLMSIIENGFYPKFFLEELSSLHVGSKIAIPMTCFCDIPLSQIKTHSLTYGQYGIGMHKSWGTDKLICPVMYAYPRAHSTHALATSIQSGYRIVNKKKEDLSKLEITYFNSTAIVSSFIKSYEGLDKKGKIKRFYNEREWRSVPEVKEGIAMYIPEKQFINDKPFVLEQEKKLGIERPLKFTPEDIKYIIIPRDQNKATLIRDLKRVKSGYTKNEIEILLTKVITIQQVFEDF